MLHTREMATRRSRMLGMGARLLTIGVLIYAVWDNSHKVPDDLESDEYVQNAAEYTVNTAEDEVQTGPWNLKLPVGGFGRSRKVDETCLSIAIGDPVLENDGSDPENTVGTVTYRVHEGWVVGGGEDDDDCSSKGGKFTTGTDADTDTNNKCLCITSLSGAAATYGTSVTRQWSGYAGKNCNVKVCAGSELTTIGNDDSVTVTTAEAEDATHVTAFEHPRDKAGNHDLPDINVPLLTSVTCILVCLMLGYKAIVAYFPTQELDQSLRRRGIIVSPYVLEWLETLMVAALIACCLLTALCMFRGIQDPSMHTAITAHEILKICFITLVLCNGFFTETQRGDSIASLSAGFVSDATSALGTLYAIFYLSEEYQLLDQTEEYFVQPVYVGAIVFLSVHLATCVLASFPVISNNRGALALARLIKAPYQFLACFALSTLMCAYVTARRLQNSANGGGSAGVETGYPNMARQAGRKDDVCNFIGTEEQRADSGVSFTLNTACTTKDGDANMWVWGCWAFPLALHLLFVVVTRMQEVTEVVDEIRGAAGRVAAGASGIAGSVAAGAEVTPFLPTRKNRYSRIRVETSV